MFPLLLALFLTTPTFARGLFDVETGGSFKAILFSQQLRQKGLFARDDISGLEQRLRLEGVLTAPGFRFEIADELSFFAHRPNPSVIPLPTMDAANAWNTRSRVLSEDSFTLNHRLDRAFVQITLGDVEWRIGKQVIPTGVGHLFAAVSQVPRQPFIIVDPEYPVTEDAVTAIWNGPFTLEARYLPKVPGQQRDNFHLRAKGSKMGNDVALTAGRTDDKSFVGLEAAGNLGDALWRGELVGYDKSDRSYVQGLIGLDRVLTETLRGEMEIFFNGLAGTAHRSSPYGARWYHGLSVTYDPSPLWSVHLIAITNLSDPSCLAHLSVSYSITANADLVAGRFQGIGHPEAEFGGLKEIGPGMQLGIPDLTYLLLRWHF